MNKDDFDDANENPESSSLPPADRELPLAASGELAQNGASFRLPLWVKGGLILAVGLLAGVGYQTGLFHELRPPAVPPTTAGNASGADVDPEEIAKRPKVDDFILTDADKKQQKLSDFHGNVVILSFWASWCTPCLVELPTFAEIDKTLHDRGLRVLAINVDEGDEGKVFARDFWNKEKFKFPTYFDTDKHLQQQFAVDILPSNFVIDRAGRIAFSGFGANDWNNPQTKDFIEGLLQEQEPASN